MSHTRRRARARDGVHVQARGAHGDKRVDMFGSAEGAEGARGTASKSEDDARLPADSRRGASMSMMI